MPKISPQFYKTYINRCCLFSQVGTNLSLAIPGSGGSRTWEEGEKGSEWGLGRGFNLSPKIFFSEFKAKIMQYTIGRNRNRSSGV